MCFLAEKDPLNGWGTKVLMFFRLPVPEFSGPYMARHVSTEAILESVNRDIDISPGLSADKLSW